MGSASNLNQQRQMQFRDDHFAQLYAKCKPGMLRISGKILKNNDPEDSVQEVFLKAWKARDRFRGDAEPSTWLYKITWNHLLAKLRSQKGKFPEELDPFTPAQDFDQLQLAASNQKISIIMEAIFGLPAAYRTVLLANLKRDSLGYTQKMMADELKMTATTFKTRLSRGRKRLKARLLERNVRV